MVDGHKSAEHPFGFITFSGLGLDKINLVRRDNFVPYPIDLYIHFRIRRNGYVVNGIWKFNRYYLCTRRVVGFFIAYFQLICFRIEIRDREFGFRLRKWIGIIGIWFEFDEAVCIFEYIYLPACRLGSVIGYIVSASFFF